MRKFSDLGAFLSHLAALEPALRRAEHDGLEHGARLIEAEAKAEIGHYQDAAGPFPAWAPLSDATLNGFDLGNGRHIPGKVELGFAPPDNPLLRDGSLRDAITHSMHGDKAMIGVKPGAVAPSYGAPVDIADVAIWQEFGTKNMPPRSFLGGAAVRKGEEAAKGVGERVAAALAGKPPGAVP